MNAMFGKVSLRPPRTLLCLDKAVRGTGSRVSVGGVWARHNSGEGRKFRLSQYHIDTRKFALQLERQGFTPSQAEGVLKALSTVLQDTVGILGSDLVSKEEFSRRAYQQKVDFTKLKSELQGLDKTEFVRVSNELERLGTDIEKIRQRFKEQIGKTRANVRLDLNLEKGRMREEAAERELKIKETNTRIDQELANFKTQIEGSKSRVAQWLIGITTGICALVLTYVRLLT